MVCFRVLFRHSPGRWKNSAGVPAVVRTPNTKLEQYSHFVLFGKVTHIHRTTKTNY